MGYGESGVYGERGLGNVGFTEMWVKAEELIEFPSRASAPIIHRQHLYVLGDVVGTLFVRVGVIGHVGYGGYMSPMREVIRECARARV